MTNEVTNDYFFFTKKGTGQYYATSAVHPKFK